MSVQGLRHRALEGTASASAGPCGRRADFQIGRKRYNWDLHGHRVIREGESRDGSLGTGMYSPSSEKSARASTCDS